uniref:TadE family protein n=1 Tax=uncultured Caulobacter sp. TaxID=158749 RepID=UPI0025EDEB2B|nr:TadE family protein [uncultured Caulobacter sp.]
MRGRKPNKTVRGPESGAVAVEFAITGPLFLMLLIGILVWGQYFWVSHTVQQLANDAARAALAGLSTAERESLARATLTAEVADYPSLRPEAAAVIVDNQADRLTVSIRYDTAQDAFRAFDGLVPTPPKTVLRQASVRLGGY